MRRSQWRSRNQERMTEEEEQEGRPMHRRRESRKEYNGKPRRNHERKEDRRHSER